MPSTQEHLARPSSLFKGVITAFEADGYVPQRHFDYLVGGGRIRCPACKWQPPKRSRWNCVSMGPPENFSAGCGHIWNTFDTRGNCPGCSHQWQHTTCLSCFATSPHDDWYDKGSAGQKP